MVSCAIKNSTTYPLVTLFQKNFMHLNLSLLLSHERLELKRGQFTGLNHIALVHLILEILFTATMLWGPKIFLKLFFFRNDGHFEFCNDRSFTMLKKDQKVSREKLCRKKYYKGIYVNFYIS